MAKLNQTAKRIQGEISEIENYLEVLKTTEPEAYQQEKPESDKKLADLQVQHLEALIEIYKIQNPEKYKTKAEALEAKLEYLKQGGDPINWNYATWVMVNQVKKDTNSEISNDVVVQCDKCDFKAKNGPGLKKHKTTHNDDPQAIGFTSVGVISPP